MLYSDKNRGVIQNRDQATQVNDFSNLRFGNITPTDIDGFIDFGNTHFVFIETKYKGAKLPFGQKLALERLCDASTAAGIKSVAIVAEHDSSGDIDVGNAVVKLYRYRGAWVEQLAHITVFEAVTKFKSQK